MGCIQERREGSAGREGKYFEWRSERKDGEEGSRFDSWGGTVMVPGIGGGGFSEGGRRSEGGICGALSAFGGIEV